MLQTKLNGPRRILRLLLAALTRLKGADILLFLAVMMVKLYLFDRFIHVQYMEMNGTDALVALGTLALIAFWTLWLPARGRLIALIVLDLAMTLVVYADLIYYRYFQDFISIPVLFQAGQVESLGGSISTLMIAKDLVLLADWPLIVPFLVYLIWLGKRDMPVPKRRSAPLVAAARIGMSAVLFAAGYTLVFGTIHDARSTWAKGLFEQSYWNVSLYNLTGVLGFHGYDAYRFARQNWFGAGSVTAAERSEAFEYVKQRGEERRRLEQDGLFGAYKGSNVIVVQAEAFQNFVVGRSIGGREVTPNFNKLMKESAYFSQFYHQTAQGRTSDADFAANCSLQPVTNGSVFIMYAQHSYDCSPSVLKDHGYSAAAYHAYDGGFWNRNAMYANMGYDSFYSKKNFVVDERVGWSVGDKSFFKQSVELMAKEERPFYSFLITLSSHHPYTMPDSEKALDTGELEGTIMGDYLQAMHYADAALGVLVEELKAKGLWDNTIVVFYGDHDNSIKEWELFETFLGRKLNRLDQQMILKQVPLLVHLPDGAHAGVYSGVGGQLDIAPTIMHLLGISTTDKVMLGTPLLTEQPAQEGKIVALRNGAYTDGHVYFNPSGAGESGNSCLDIAALGSAADMNTCQALSEQVNDELYVSDLIVVNDLVPALRKLYAQETGKTVAAAPTGHD
ncbi:LTA synthase family protein [Paenibacillus thailandensis]|uniref:LTA synthase family protein n=1 Tax=Paenibacillus thailandensis TaxID=393250 RepID=A0ABW5QZ52_9BACL